VDYYGNTYRSFLRKSPASCCRSCLKDRNCRSWSFNRYSNRCSLKRTLPESRDPSDQHISGYPKRLERELKTRSIDPSALYMIGDATNRFILTVWQKTRHGLRSVHPVYMFNTDFHRMYGKNLTRDAAFRFVKRGQGLYSIMTIDGGSLVITGKNQYGIRYKNPVRVEKKPPFRWDSDDPSREDLFRITSNRNGTWNISAGDKTGSLALWDKTVQFDRLLDRGAPVKRLPVLVHNGQYRTCIGRDCDFTLTRIGKMT
jgi:hypothetical protein